MGCGSMAGVTLRFRRHANSQQPAVRPMLPIVHCTHHKAGTVWFRRILSGIADAQGFTFTTSYVGRNVPSGDVVLYAVVGPLSEMEVATAFHGASDCRQAAADDFMERSGLRPGGFRGTHMVRDPRDMVVSGWHYHLRCTEDWVVTPLERFGGRSYQDLLNSLDPHDGLMAEIKEMTRRTLVHMARWNYEQPEFLELRYEDLLTDELMWFDRLFRHYGFEGSLLHDSMAIAHKYSRGNLSVVGDGHVRSGEPGEWREHLEPDHVAAFKELTGHLLVDLGYEQNLDW
jgi:hypothetical protein